MKAGVFAIAAAAIASGVSAGRGHAARRHAHEAFHVGRHLVTGASAAPIANATCGCTTIYTTITGEGGRMFNASIEMYKSQNQEPWLTYDR